MHANQIVSIHRRLSAVLDRGQHSAEVRDALQSAADSLQAAVDLLRDEPAEGPVE